jgi:N-acetylglutamate synthase-like GNAT family acetyltransferase
VGHIRHIASDPACLRRGVAGAIMQRAFDSAREARVELLCCLKAFREKPESRIFAKCGAPFNRCTLSAVS